MLEEKIEEIRSFFSINSNPEIAKKYARYFKEGFDGYGIETKIFERQRDTWLEDWKADMSLKEYLNLGDELMKTGKFEEKSIAIAFVASERKNYTPKTFDRIGNWFEVGISNWATTDVLCMLVLSSFLLDHIICFDDLKKWTNSRSVWKRRAVPVTLVELLKEDLEPSAALTTIEPLMLDDSEYVQKGIGTLLRGLWKKHPEEIEAFLLQWKDSCGRKIVQYTTEKMDREHRKKFKRIKK